MPVHGGNQTRIMSAFALNFAIRHQFPPVREDAAFVSGNYFRDLKVTAGSGRLFTERDTQPGAPPVAALGHRYWQQHFGGDPAVVARIHDDRVVLDLRTVQENEDATLVEALVRATAVSR